MCHIANAEGRTAKCFEQTEYGAEVFNFGYTCETLRIPKAGNFGYTCAVIANTEVGNFGSIFLLL